MMPSNQFMFLDQVGVSNSHQNASNIQQAFMPLEPNPHFQSHFLHQSLTKPVHSPSPPNHQPTPQYSPHPQASAQSIMAPPAQSGIASHFFGQVGHPNQQQHFQQQQQQQFHFPQMNNMNGHSQMQPMQNGTRGIQSNSMNQDFYPSSKNSIPEEFRTNLPVSTQSHNSFIPDEFKQMPQMFMQAASPMVNNSIPAQYRQMPSEFRQTHSPTSNGIPNEFRQIPKPPRLIPSSSLHNEVQQSPAPKPIIPDEFRQAPIQTFGEQLEQANVVVSGLIENIQEMIEGTDDPKLNSSDLNVEKNSTLDDSIVEISNGKNENGDIDDLVHELLKDVEEMDSSFVADTSKDRTIEINDSIQSDDYIDTNNDETISERAEEQTSKPFENPVPHISPSQAEESPVTEAEHVPSPIMANTNTEHDSSPIDQMDESISDTPIEMNPAVTSSPKSVTEEISDPVSDNSPKSLENPSVLTEEMSKSEIEMRSEEENVDNQLDSKAEESINGLKESCDPVIKSNPCSESEEGVNLANETDISLPMEEKVESNDELSHHLTLRKDIFFLDAVDFKKQKNLIGMETDEREALVASLNLPKESTDLSLPPLNKSPFLQEELKTEAGNQAVSFGNDQLNEIFSSQLTAQPRPYGFPNLPLPSNIPPILGAILTQQQNNARNLNFPPMSQPPQSSSNSFSMDQSQLFNYLNYQKQKNLNGQNGFHSPSLNFRPLQPSPVQSSPKSFGDLLSPKSKSILKDRPPTTPRKRYCGNKEKTGEPLLVDPTLPPGWSRSVSQRKTGASAGSWDTYIHAPNGKRFRSRMEIKRYFEKTGETQHNWQDFDFNPFGSKGQQRPAPGSSGDNTEMGSMLMSQLSQDRPVAQEEANNTSENMDDFNIQDFLSCELGTN